MREVYFRLMARHRVRITIPPGPIRFGALAKRRKGPQSPQEKTRVTPLSGWRGGRMAESFPQLAIKLKYAWKEMKEKP